MTASSFAAAGRCGPVVAILLTFLVLAACTSVEVQQEAGATEQLPQPDRVLVYNFAVTPQEVQLDAVGSAIIQTFDGTADSVQEQQVGHAVADALAKHLVSRRLRDNHRPRDRTDANDLDPSADPGQC